MAHKNTSILIFTDKYPYGTGESFFESELTYLADVFERICLVPLENAGYKNPRVLPGNVKLVESPFHSVKNKAELLLKGLFNSSGLFRFFKEFVFNKVYLSPKKFRNWFTHLLLVRAEISYLKSMKPGINPDEFQLVYFYWGLRWSQVLPFIHLRPKTIIRFHGSDLYEERNCNYIPFRKEQLAKIDLAVFVSGMGKKYLLERYPEYVRDTAVFRLGTEDFGTGRYIKVSRSHIVSCSNIIPLKHIDLLAKALKYIKREVLWTHIGEGPFKESIREIASEAGSHLQYVFKGQLDRMALMKFYQDTPVDLFINTSLSEGVPVSVMEALSFGIPVIATDVGGTSEIVDDEVGSLISSGITAEGLAVKIMEVLDSPRYNDYRKNARLRWEERCQATVLFSRFAEFLKDY